MTPGPLDSDAGSVPVVRPVVVAGARSAEEIRALVDAARLLGPARRVLDAAAEGEATREECAAMAQRIVDLIGHPVTDEPPHAIVERDSLRGVVQAVREWLAKAEPYPELNGNKFAEVRAALAAAADAPQPEPDAELAELRAEAQASTATMIESAKAKIELLRQRADLEAELAAMTRYAEGLARGLSDAEARAEGWPTAAADAPQPGPDRANTPTARRLLAELQAERQAAGDDAAADFCGTKPGAFSHLRPGPSPAVLPEDGQQR